MQISHIFVEVDPTQPPDAAWALAVTLAERARARLTLVHVVPEVPRIARTFVTATVERDLVAHRRESLDTRASRLRGVKADVSVLRGRPAQALVDEVRRRGCDLLLRAHDRGVRGSSRRPFGPGDQQLLRQCPCPVWLVGRTGRRPGPIVCAVNADPANAVGQALNRRIIDIGLTIGDFLGVRTVVVQAWSAFAERALQDYLPPSVIKSYVQASRAAVQADFGALIRTLGRRADDVDALLLKGEAEAVIPAIARRRRATAVVMGTVARTGIPGLVVGNTAERVLARLRGSVMAVKPEGFGDAGAGRGRRPR